jgi:aminopeptidase N
VFDTFLPKSYQIDLNDLSTAHWSLVPSTEDFVAEIVTGRYGALTYARSGAEPEDISFFDRRRHRNIAVYSSSQKAGGHPAFFSEDDKRDYDITNYDIDASFAPDRSWVDGTAHLTLRARSFFSTLTVRLAESLVVRNVSSPQFGRLLHLRIVGQNNVLIGLPSTIVSGTDLDLVITYGGRLPPQGIDREAVVLQQQERGADDVIVVPPEVQYTYSNRSYWYPQALVTDYATAKLNITVPSDLDVVASGAPEGSATPLETAAGQRPRKRYVFEARKPTRYLGVLISRLQPGAARQLKLQDEEDPLTLNVVANPRQVSRARGMTDKAADVLKFYASLMNDVPYDTFTLALTESDVPGGHSPAYFAMLNQPLPTSPFSWTNDPVAFQNYPSFFIAHEIAHQWWGQAVGWKNYHEQWISEGFAQYFAALYAERERGPEQFTAVLRQMRKWAIDLSPQGPVYLGYRLGHLRGEGRTFRALVYNKGAMVLHMLRRLMGDEAFFSGLRDFYATWRYDKAGTDDFRIAMEKAAGGKPLERFFDRWIYGSGIPVVRYTSTVADGQLKLQFEQKGEVYDLPLTVTITYSDGTTQDVLVALGDKLVEKSVPLKGAVRSVDVNKDSAALVELER